MGENWNVGSKALQNSQRRRLSGIEMSESHGFHFDLMYIFVLARGIRSSLTANRLQI